MALPLANASDSSGPGDRFTVCQIQFEMPEEWTHLPCIQNSTCDFSMLQPCRHSHDSVPKLWLSSSSCSPRWTSWSQPPEARLRSKTAPNRPGKLLLHLNPGGALTKSRKAWKPSLQPACSSHRDKELLSAAPSSFFSRWVFEIYTLCKRLRLVTGTIPMSRVSLIGIGYSFTISCSSCETHFRTDRNDHTNTTTPAWGLPK